MFQLHDTSRNAPVKQQGCLTDNGSLQPDAGNLAAVILCLRHGDRVRHQRIARTVKQVALFFRDFVLEPELAPHRVRLWWQQEGRKSVEDTVLVGDAYLVGRRRGEGQAWSGVDGSVTQASAAPTPREPGNPGTRASPLRPSCGDAARHTEP
jgi:hypothetical protein